MKNGLLAFSRVYVLEGVNGLVKVGASREPKQRRKACRADGGGKTALVWQSERHYSAYMIERAVLDYLAPYRVSGEWFKVRPSYAVEVAKTAFKLAVPGITSGAILRGMKGVCP